MSVFVTVFLALEDLSSPCEPTLLCLTALCVGNLIRKKLYISGIRSCVQKMRSTESRKTKKKGKEKKMTR